MSLSDMLLVENIQPCLEIPSKKQLFHTLARFAVDSLQGDEDAVFSDFLDRERLGSTGIGNGVAVPHVQMAHLEATQIAFIRLADPIPFQALDGIPVDLIVAVFAPTKTGEHLKALAQVSRMMRDENFCSLCRHARSRDDLYGLLSGDSLALYKAA